MKSSLALTEQPSSDGYFYIYTALENEAWLKQSALELLKNDLYLTPSKSKRTLETIALFNTGRGSDIGIAQDDFYSLVIESKDFEFLRQVFQRLQELEARSQNRGQ